jgi:class 3 adenylate cyclase/tetratricopeptide (TPR) repeat protein
MITCPSCGTENPAQARFCMECTTPLGSPARPVAEERKVVTALFCDLVSFTSRSESADPEDVRAMLASYFEVVRAAIEAYGGVVEKFIGDAVVGVFGAPVTHEDDAERAVRAGLRIVEDAESLTAIDGAPLTLRVGINTGEALVRLGVSPSTGESLMAGDAINTASRLQSVAPEMGVAVGLATHDATATIFEYEELEPAVLKGKAEPVRVFWAKAARARLGTDLTRTHDSPFVGREIDLALLQGIFAKTTAAAAPQLVTVVGEPGLGKSRLVAELGAHVDRLPELVTWRQGRCLPYGEGITFWALGEIVKAHAGVLESDDVTTVSAKLDLVLPEGPERPWFRQHLQSLLGIGAPYVAEQEELFAAWRRYLEQLAEEGPVVLVLEDLHWADPPMLAFIEHLADRAEGVPLMIVGTARPELFERYPGYAQGLKNLTTISLVPLTSDETSRLVSGLLESAVLPAELQAPILERAGGNPLYAEEFVRLLKDQGRLVRRGASWELTSGAEIPFPDSIHALIAARLDTLAPDRKDMLANAAVVGKIFWGGAIAAMGEVDEGVVAEAMHELSRKELVRTTRRSSMDGETEYAFWHVLARDVAYAQIPRASRASRHLAAAAWIESKAPDRLEDLADVLAHHYVAALELARDAGDAATTARVERPAFRFLTLAGERAHALDAAAALDAFERALALAPPGHEDRPAALVRFGDVASEVGRNREAADAMEEAIDAFRTRGDVLEAARTMTRLSPIGGTLNEPRLELAREAVAMLESLPPGPELVYALGNAGFDVAATGDPEGGLALVERGIAIAAELGLPTPARLLGYRGNLRCWLGDHGGFADFEEAERGALEAGEGRVAAVTYNNHGVQLWAIEGPTAALRVFDEGIRVAEDRGMASIALVVRTSALAASLSAGDLEQVRVVAPQLAARAETDADEFNLIEIRAVWSVALSFEGRASEAAGWVDGLVGAARLSARADMAVIGLGSAGIVSAGLDDRAATIAHLSELAAVPGLGTSDQLPAYLPAIVRAALSFGELDLAERLAVHLQPHNRYGEHARVAIDAALAEARGELAAAAGAYADAARRWERFGCVPEEGFALLGRGRCLVATGGDGAGAILERARERFERCGMRPGMGATEALLAEAMRISS